MTPRVIEGLDRWPYGARGTQNLADRTKRLDIRILAELLVLSSEFCALRALNRIRLTDVSTPLEVSSGAPPRATGSLANRTSNGVNVKIPASPAGILICA